MIPAQSFAGKKVALFGLGGSGSRDCGRAQTGRRRGSRMGRQSGQRGAGCRNRHPGRRPQGGRLGWLSHRWCSRRACRSRIRSRTGPSNLRVAQAWRLIGDIELFARERRASAPDAPFIAITGTNGKSTTTALTAHILRSAGRDTQMGGNIGRAVMTLDPPQAERHYVVECSSYQIDLALRSIRQPGCCSI